MLESLMYNLKHNRRNAIKNLTAWFIFGAIIVVFIFWGLQPNQQGVAAGGAAATVNNATISMAQMMDMVERLRRDPRFSQLQGLGGEAERQILQSQAMGQLIELELFSQGADRERIWTSDAEVRDTITSIPQFQENGRFKRDFYMSYLQGTRKTSFAFEEELRREQSINRTVKLFGSAMKPLALENEKMQALKKRQANVEFISFSSENLVIPETLPVAEVNSFLAQAGVEEKVKAYFDTHKQDFSKPEQVKARHILIRTQPGDSASETKALERIQDLARRAKSEDFAKLARQFSDDPGSKANGGLLDFFSRGRMVPEFEEAAFALKPGELSAPVKTEYGYHLIQILEKKPAEERSFETVRDEIAAILLAREKSAVAVEELQSVLQKQNGDVTAVNAFVAAHKLKWDETGAFNITTDTVPKIGPIDEVVQVAFRLSADQPVAKQLVREGSRAILLRYKAVPADKSASKADESSDLLAEMLASRRGEEAVRKWVDGLRKSAKIATNPQFMGGPAAQ